MMNWQAGWNEWGPVSTMSPFLPMTKSGYNGNFVMCNTGALVVPGYGSSLDWMALPKVTPVPLILPSFHSTGPIAISLSGDKKVEDSSIKKNFTVPSFGSSAQVSSAFHRRSATVASPRTSPTNSICSSHEGSLKSGEPPRRRIDKPRKRSASRKELEYHGRLDENESHEWHRILVWRDMRHRQFYDCECGRRKPTQDLAKIKRHTASHAVKTYDCQFCDRKFEHYLGLNSHMRTHKQTSK